MVSLFRAHLVNNGILCVLTVAVVTQLQLAEYCDDGGCNWRRPAALRLEFNASSAAKGCQDESCWFDRCASASFTVLDLQLCYDYCSPPTGADGGVPAASGSAITDED